MGFQSTLPVRGATEGKRKEVCNIIISIHAPREGSDFVDEREVWQSVRFQSTLPVRGATPHRLLQPRPGDISIHAPREGSDGLPSVYRLRMA